jgi:hypothetical protein
MTLFKKILLLLIGAALIFSWTTKKPIHKKLSGIYCFAANESFFIYEFFNDSSYQFRTQGHFGYSKTNGKYNLNIDSLILIPYSKKSQPDSTFSFKNKDTLLLIDDTSIVSLNKKDKYCKTFNGQCCTD